MANLMSKRHFEVIASGLAKARPPDHTQQSGLDEAKRMELRAMDEQWIRSVESICDALQTTNPSFDREKFTDWVQGNGRTRYSKK